MRHPEDEPPKQAVVVPFHEVLRRRASAARVDPPSSDRSRAREIGTHLRYVSDNVEFLEAALHDLVAPLQALLEGKGEVVVDPVDLAFLAEEIPRALEECREGIRLVATLVHGGPIPVRVDESDGPA